MLQHPTATGKNWHVHYCSKAHNSSYDVVSYSNRSRIVVESCSYRNCNRPIGRNRASILYRFRDIASYLSKIADFNTPYLHLAPLRKLGVTPVEFLGDLWHQKTRIPALSCCFVCVILRLAVLSVRYQQRCDLSLPILQQLVLIIYTAPSSHSFLHCSSETLGSECTMINYCFQFTELVTVRWAPADVRPISCREYTRRSVVLTSTQAGSVSLPCQRNGARQDVLASNFANIHRFKNTDRLSNKPFLIWLLTTPPHFKNVATLPCNLSLIVFFWY